MYVTEPAKHIPVAGEFDVVVCGGGPAGVTAAITAARAGLRTLLIEAQGCLGGVWTAGLLAYVLDPGGKGGFLTELQDRLRDQDAHRVRGQGPHFTFDVETMKFLLERLCLDAGVGVRLHTRVVAALKEGNALRAVITESASGREVFVARVFIDATGNGDLAARSGCNFETGHPGTGLSQPATLLAIVTGLPEDDFETIQPGSKERFRQLLRSVGVDPTYGQPSIHRLPHPDLAMLMINHEYAVKCDSADDITRATLSGRQEVYEAIRAMRRLPGWERLHLVHTPAHIGLREGRRIHGLFRLTVDDITAGRRFDDGICLVRFGVDVHALYPGYNRGAGNEGLHSRPYHIPFRCLVAADVVNLAMAGRCISGDFYAHASYRVTGNAVAMGEAAGLGVALAVDMTPGHGPVNLHGLDGRVVAKAMQQRGYEL